LEAKKLQSGGIAAETAYFWGKDYPTQRLESEDAAILNKN
jgi:hypothetical protein